MLVLYCVRVTKEHNENLMTTEFYKLKYREHFIKIKYTLFLKGKNYLKFFFNNEYIFPKV